MSTQSSDPTTLPKLAKKSQTLFDEYRALREEMEAHEAELSRLQNRQDAIKGEIAALEIPPLKAEMEANNEKIARLEERKRFFETDLKIREAQKKELLRKQRNRRIFTRGGMLEAFLIEPLLLTDNEVHDFLEKVFRMPEVDSLLRKLIDDACTLEDDESEKDAEDGENGGPFVEGRNYTPITVQLRFCGTFSRKCSQNKIRPAFLPAEKVIGFALYANHRASPAPIKSATQTLFSKKSARKRGGENNILSAF